MKQFRTTITAFWQNLWLPVVVGICASIMTLLLFRELLAIEKLQIERNVELAAVSIGEDVTAQIQTRILGLERMAQRWEIRPRTPKNEWEDDAINYWQGYPGFQALEWIDSNNYVRWVMPLTGNEAVQNRSLIFESRRQTALEKAKETRSAAMTNAVTLIQGGKGFLVYVPLFLKNLGSQPSNQNNFDGFIAGVFRTQSLLDAILDKNLTQEYAIAIFDDGEEIYNNQHQHSNREFIGKLSHQIQVKVNDITWLVQVSPTAALLAKQQSPLAKVVLIGGLTTAILLTWVVYITQCYQKNAKQVGLINVELSNEIYERQMVEASLQQSNAKMEDLYDNAPCGYHSLDRNGCFVQINDTELNWLGYSRNEVIGKKFTEFVTDESLLIFEKNFPNFQKLGWVKDLEFEIIRGDGTIMPVLLNATAIKDAAGNFVMSRSSLFDISERQTAQRIRKQTEDALRESEERFRGAFANASIGMALVACDGLFLQVNQSLCKMLGYSEQELLTTTFQAITHPDDLDIDLNYLHKTLRGEIQSYQMEKRYFHKQGHTVWILLSVSLVRDKAGQPLYFVSQIQDISERQAAQELRKQAEKELRWQEALLRAMANASPLAFYVVDETTNDVLYFNRRFCEIWGIECLEEQNINAVKKDSAIDCADCQPTSNSLAAFRKTCQSLPLESERELIEDEVFLSERVIRRCSAQIRDKQDKYLGRLYIFEDISDRKQSETILRNLSTALKSAVEGIAQLDLQGRYIYVNRAYAQMLGYEAEQIIGIKWQTTVDPEDLGKVTNAYQKMLSLGKAEVEAKALRQDGSVFDKQVVMVKTYDQDQNVTGNYCFVKDISDRREIERLKDEFVSIVSHELRTPLTSIRGSLGLVANGVLQSQPEKAQRMLEIAVNNSDRLIRLINDILDIERIESGKVTMTKQICDAANLMSQSIDGIRVMAEKAEVNLVVTPISARLWADPDRIIQTLTNLLSNAIKFSPPGTTISLTAKLLPNSQILFQVKDQGRGIPAGKLETIFERFQQVDASDSRKKGGTGLGLTICRSIIQHHDGRIWAESILGEGSTFYISLPLMPQEKPETLPIISTNAVLVMVCDDDSSVRAVLETMLEEQGYQTIPAASGQEVVEMAMQSRPDAIFLNLMMPGMSAWETLAVLKQQPQTQHIPVIILCALMPDATITTAHPEVSDWIIKPPDEKLLFQVLSKALSEHPSTKVLIVEDDLDLAHVLIATFERYGIKAHHAKTGREAIELSQSLIPYLLVLDLGLPEVDGFAVVDWLQHHNCLHQVPLIVYSAKDLTEGDRTRLNLGQTLFLTKGRVTPEEFEQRAIALLNCIVSEKREAKKLGN